MHRNRQLISMLAAVSVSQAGLVVIPLFTLCAGSCRGSPGKPTMSFKSSTESFQLGTISVITLTATGTDDGQPWVDGSMAPVFSTTWGSFESQVDNPGGADVPSNPNGTITGHTCLVQLFPDSSPPANGSFVVTAIYTDTAGDQVTANITIAVNIAPVESLTFDCETYNIGALVDFSTAMEIRCNAQAFDANNIQVPGANIQFLAEAGSVLFDSEANTYAYHPFVSGPGNVGSKPLDVMPNTAWAEPSYVDTNDPTMPTRNPRDGLATIVAYVPADPEAVLQNGLNSVAFAGAPFIDVDDTGTFHAGDPFLDINKNQTYATSQSTILWKQIKILWTGSVQATPPVATVTWNGGPPTDVDLPYGMSGSIVWTVLDQNLNVVAANNTSEDEVDWVCSPTPAVVTRAPGVSMLARGDGPRFGFDMDSNYDITSRTAADWEIGAEYSLSITNESDCESGATAALFDCYGTVSRTMWTDQNGNPQDETSTEYTLSINGTAEPQPPTCL